MKLLRKSLLLFAALLGVTLFPGCGGSADDTGNQFVSVTSFKSGSVGFYIQGSPVVRIISRGQPNDVSPGRNPFPTIERPDNFNDDYVTSGMSTAEQWEKFATDNSEETEGDTSCLVNVTIRNSSTNEYSLDGVATYTVSRNLGYLRLDFDEVSGSSNNLEYAALIHFMGAVTRSDLTYSTDGDATDNASAAGTADRRVVITSLTGSTIKFWFNFETNQCLTELCYVAQTHYVDNSDSAPEMHGVWRITHPFLRLN